MIDLDITYLNDLKTVLRYKDLRSVRSYLKKMGVPVFTDKSNRPYCLKLQYERALLADKIQNLKARYGKDWLRVMQSEMQLYASHKAIIESSIPESTVRVKSKEIPQTYGPWATKFLTALQSI